MPNLRAFVIMPFDPEFDAVYAELIVPPLSEAGFEVQRADDVEARQNVLVDVVRGIAEADLIVADLTTGNANVFYELGLAHAIGVPTVLIAHQDSATDIPFDLRQYRTELYDTHFQRAKLIVDVLGMLGKAHAEGNLSFGSPISDFLPGASKPAIHAQRTGAAGPRASAREAVTPPEGDADLADEDESHAGAHGLDNDQGLIDYLDSLSEGSDELSAAAGTIVEATERVGTEIVALTERLEALDPAAPTVQTLARQLLLQAAEILDRYAVELETEQSGFEAAVDVITSSGLGYLTLLSETPAESRDGLESARSTSAELQATVERTRGELMGMRDAIQALPSLLKPTNRARNRTVRALDSLLASFDRVTSYAEQSAGLAKVALDAADPVDESGEVLD